MATSRRGFIQLLGLNGLAVAATGCATTRPARTPAVAPQPAPPLGAPGTRSALIRLSSNENSAGPGGKVLISTDGGGEPIWAPSGRELFYRNGAKMMVLDIQTQPALKAGPPRMLFEREGFPTGSRQWDVAPDGRRFLFLAPVGGSTPPPFTVLLNWQPRFPR